MMKLRSLVLCSVLCGAVAFSQLAPPPVISLDLGAASDIHVTASDASGNPCNSFAADKAACHAVRVSADGHGGGGQIFYKFCEVGDHGCELPAASAQDHHEGALTVTTSTFLHVRSDQHALPSVVDAKVAAVDFDQRGEFYMTYDAADSSGNAATQIKFHVFVVDLLPPTLTLTPPSAGGALQVSARAVDAYDGDVSDTIALRLTTPRGESFAHTGGGAVAIDAAQSGTWKVSATARDFASAFGKDYASNAVQVSGTVTVAGGQLASYDIGAQTASFATTTTTTAAAPSTGSGGGGGGGRHYIPPVLAISWGGHVVARGSPFGVHHTEKAYRAHLANDIGLAASTIEQHVASIIAREERLARKHPEMVWNGGKLW